MASPQKEDGFTPIANEIMEALCYKSVVLSDYEWTCLIFIFRKTYGWNKSEDRISLSQFVSGTHIKRPHICRSLKKLLRKNIITQSGNGYHVTYSFQKNYELWKSLPSQVTLPKQVTVASSPQSGNEIVPKQVIQVVPNQGHTKDTITKDTKQKKEASKPKDLKECEEYFKKQFSSPLEANKFYDHFCSNGWKVGGKTTMQDWQAAARNWIRRNKQTQGNTSTLTKHQQKNIEALNDFSKRRSATFGHGNLQARISLPNSGISGNPNPT